MKIFFLSPTFVKRMLTSCKPLFITGEAKNSGKVPRGMVSILRTSGAILQKCKAQQLLHFVWHRGRHCLYYLYLGQQARSCRRLSLRKFGYIYCRLQAPMPLPVYAKPMMSGALTNATYLPPLHPYWSASTAVVSIAFVSIH